MRRGPREQRLPFAVTRLLSAACQRVSSKPSVAPLLFFAVIPALSKVITICDHLALPPSSNRSYVSLTKERRVFQQSEQ